MNNSKDLISDEELLRVARDCRSNSAFDELIRRYTYYAKSLARQYQHQTPQTGIRKEELEQIAIISFYSSYKKIRIDTKSFYTYWSKIAKREIAKYIKENSYLEGGRAFAGLSFDEQRFDNDESLLSDYIGEEDEQMKKDLLINDLMIAINHKGTALNPKEKAVLKQFLKGLDFKSISIKMKISESSVYYIFNHAVRKLRKILNNN